MSFDEIVQRTYCPFARQSLIGASITVLTAEIERELMAHRASIEQFFERANDAQYDGMLITFTDASLGRTLSALTTLTRRFYRLLDEMFVGVYLDDHPDPDHRWYAMIGGERFFLVSFAPCYPENSPRYTHGDPNTYFMLQPASTFERHAEAIDRLRERIGHAFSAAGKPYDVALANKENDMFKVVMPMTATDPYVPWWLPPETAGTRSRTHNE